MAKPDDPWPPWVTEWILPYLTNRALWPVWVALVGHVVVLVAGLMLVAWRTGSPEASVALAILGVGTVWLAIQERRRTGALGGLTLSTVSTWVTSTALALLGQTTGIL